MTQEEIKNEKLSKYQFLAGMYSDPYFPDFIVDKGKNILVELCLQIENKPPTSLEELYKLTHTATEKFNQLDEELNDNDSEIETAAREIIAEDFENIALNYGFEDADIEELIEPREW